MIVAVVAAIARATDHVSGQRAEASAQGNTTEITTDKTTCHTTADSADGSASARTRTIGAGGQGERHGQHEDHKCFHKTNELRVPARIKHAV